MPHRAASPPHRAPRALAVLLALAVLPLLAQPLAAVAPSRSDFPPPRPSAAGAAAGREAAAPSAAAAASAASTAAPVATPAATPVAAAPAPARSRDVAAPIAEEIRLSGRFGYALMDLESGEIIEARSVDEPFPPASVAKVFTAVYALETLGPDHRFETRLVASAPLADGAAPDLALVGGGDPELDTDQLSELAAQAKARGLLKVSRRFLVDAALWPETPRIDPEQPEEAAYNPAVSALNLDFNRVLFSWTRTEPGAWNLALEAKGLRDSAQPSLMSIALGETGESIFARRDDGEAEVWAVAGAALGKEGQRWLPVRRPAMHAADVFRSFASRRGVVLPAASPGSMPESGVLLGTAASRPLETILKDMLRYSTNLTAEVVGLAATRERQGAAPGLEASGAAMSDWARRRAAMGAGLSAPPPAAPSAPKRSSTPSRDGAALPGRLRTPAPGAPALSAGIAATMLSHGAAAPARAPAAGGVTLAAAGMPAGAFAPADADAAIDLRNHSGLSAESRVSPAAMAAFLRAAALKGEGRARAGALRPLLKAVNIGPARGEKKLPAGVDAAAKTGTLYFVRGLAGYITAASGRELAFAIFTEDLARREKLASASDGGPARGWLSRARERERRIVRAWAGAY